MLPINTSIYSYIFSKSEIILKELGLFDLFASLFFLTTALLELFDIVQQFSIWGFFYIDVDNITFFQVHDYVIFAYDSTGKKHLLNVISLKDIEAQLNPTHFFRINRSEVISKDHVERIERYSNNVLAIKMKGQISLLKTSQSNTSSFRFWV
tara:strand:+ start:392 stop:847 length:456 start_codon:yes stop_codon:yes gene_type:complete